LPRQHGNFETQIKHYIDGGVERGAGRRVEHRKKKAS
jgi:hypothetical protein